MVAIHVIYEFVYMGVSLLVIYGKALSGVKFVC
jgi:hypothetical protein